MAATSSNVFYSKNLQCFIKSEDVIAEENVPPSDEDSLNRIKRQQQRGPPLSWHVAMYHIEQPGWAETISDLTLLSFTSLNPESQAHCKLDNLQLLLFIDKLVEDVVHEANSYAQDEMLSARVREHSIWKTGKTWLQKFRDFYIPNLKPKPKKYSAKTSSERCLFFPPACLKTPSFFKLGPRCLVSWTNLCIHTDRKWELWKQRSKSWNVLEEHHLQFHFP